METLHIKLELKCGAQPSQVHSTLVTLVSRMRQTSLIRILFLLFHWTFGEAGGTPLTRWERSVIFEFSIYLYQCPAQHHHGKIFHRCLLQYNKFAPSPDDKIHAEAHRLHRCYYIKNNVNPMLFDSSEACASACEGLRRCAR